MASLSLWVHPRFALHLGKDNSFHFLPLPSLSSNKWLKIIICIQHLIVIWSMISSLVVVFLWWAHGVLSCSLTSLNCTLPHEWIWVKAEHPRKMLAGLTHLLLRGFFFLFFVLWHPASLKRINMFSSQCSAHSALKPPRYSNHSEVWHLCSGKRRESGF